MILLYHRVYSDSTPKNQWAPGPIFTSSDFRKQVQWLKNYYEIVSISDYLKTYPQSTTNACVSITFDDGLRETFENVTQILDEENIPALYFVSTSHIEPGRLLWFNYLNALCFEEQYSMIKFNGHSYPLFSQTQSRKTWQSLMTLARMYGKPDDYFKELRVKYPINSSVISKFAGMTQQQLKLLGLSDLFTVGGHTCTHPYLDKCDRVTKVKEIITNKEILERLVGQKVKYFAYPSNIYDTETISITKAAGFEAAFSVNSKRLGNDPLFEIERTGIYSSSLLKLQLKLLGVVKLARFFGLNV